MVHVFNRKELFVTFDMKEQAEIRSALSHAEIAYDVKVTNRLSPGLWNDSRAKSGSLGIDSNQMYEYRIYVKRAAYDEAVRCLRNRNDINGQT